MHNPPEKDIGNLYEIFLGWAGTFHSCYFLYYESSIEITLASFCTLFPLSRRRGTFTLLSDLWIWKKVSALFPSVCVILLTSESTGALAFCPFNAAKTLFFCWTDLWFSSLILEFRFRNWLCSTPMLYVPMYFAFHWPSLWCVPLSWLWISAGNWNSVKYLPVPF